MHVVPVNVESEVRRSYLEVFQYFSRNACYLVVEKVQLNVVVIVKVTGELRALSLLPMVSNDELRRLW
jgi:hypothetical protein